MVSLPSLPSSPRVPHIDLPFPTSSAQDCFFSAPRSSRITWEPAGHTSQGSREPGELYFWLLFLSPVPCLYPSSVWDYLRSLWLLPDPISSKSQRFPPHPVILAPNSSMFSLRSPRPRLTEKQVGREAGKLTNFRSSLPLRSSPCNP